MGLSVFTAGIDILGPLILLLSIDGRHLKPILILLKHLRLQRKGEDITMGRPRKDAVTRAYRAIDPDAREQQMINYAENLAEQKLRDGTASSQIIVHYLQLGSSKARVEQDILRQKRELMEAQTNAIRSAENLEELYEKAIAAMREYQGGSSSEFDEY